MTNTWRELFTRVEVDVVHTGDQATVLLTSTLDEAPINESWGVRDFFLFYAACSTNCGKCTGPLPKDCTCKFYKIFLLRMLKQLDYAKWSLCSPSKLHLA